MCIDELTIREGEVVFGHTLIEKTWWKGVNSMGSSGIFPANYVRKANPGTPRSQPNPVMTADVKVTVAETKSPEQPLLGSESKGGAGSQSMESPTKSPTAKLGYITDERVTKSPPRGFVPPENGTVVEIDDKKNWKKPLSFGIWAHNVSAARHVVPTASAMKGECLVLPCSSDGLWLRCVSHHIFVH